MDRSGRPRVLFICGSINQTTQMHQIAQQMVECDCFFSTYFDDGYPKTLKKLRLTEATPMGYKLSARALAYLERHHLAVDQEGRNGPYDLVVTCSDLIVPGSMRQYPVVLVQEGMTDPEGMFYDFWRRHSWFPRWLAGTAVTGLSDLYTLFCVASDGYKRHFVTRGANPDKIVVTGIPNFDNCRRFLNNTFPFRDFVLVCTSDVRETFGREDRKAFILKAVGIANGRPLVFKLHPNERVSRARREIERYAPAARIYETGSAEEMIANCSVLITRFSSTAYVGLALGKEVYSDFDIDDLRQKMPIQTGRAAEAIAAECCRLLNGAENTQRAIYRRDNLTGVSDLPRHVDAHELVP
ncbi:MAG TPA: hypothetical protein VNZ26_00400 [Vicinamibacterales bacterium]|nr:hypothetical protein [Vicinamibacterales bacterium]